MSLPPLLVLLLPLHLHNIVLAHSGSYNFTFFQSSIIHTIPLVHKSQVQEGQGCFYKTYRDPIISPTLAHMGHDGEIP